MINIEYDSEETKSKKEKEQFTELTEKLNDNDILREILYTQQKSYEQLEKIQNNTSKLVWFLIVIPIIVGIIIALVTQYKQFIP